MAMIPFLYNKQKSRKTPETNATDFDQIICYLLSFIIAPVFYHYYYNHANGTVQGSYCIRGGHRWRGSL